MNMTEKINYGYSELDSKQYTVIEDNREWRSSAACKGMDTNIFMPDTKLKTKEALAICAGCIAIKECLKYALKNEIRYGVWGGKTDKERKVILNSPYKLKKILTS